jgi:cyclic pyranopterin phosphate synthase
MPTSRDERLTLDELASMTHAFVSLGVTKVRLIGGESLARPDLAQLVERIAAMGDLDLCLTTNGSLLTERARALADAGLKRVTVSLDAIDELTFRRMTDGKTPLHRVLAGIDAARSVGLAPIKINMVVLRGVNDHAIVPMARWARREGLELRLIEYMDVGRTNGWQPSDVVTADETRQRIDAELPLDPAFTEPDSAPAKRYRYRDGRGIVGFISSISEPFCGQCTRARVSSRGELFTCLFGSRGHDLASPLRAGEDLRPLITAVWQHRSDRYSELRAEMTRIAPRPEMSAIGG